MTPFLNDPISELLIKVPKISLIIKGYFGRIEGLGVCPPVL